VGDQAESSYLAKARSYNCTPEEDADALNTLRSRSWLALRRKLEEQTSDATMLGTLRSTFEDRFRYDEKGVPRVWKPEDDIDTAFTKAKDETLALLPLFATIAPEDRSLLPSLPSPESSHDLETDATLFDPSTAFTLLSPTKIVSLESRFKRDADAAYVEAKRSLVSSVAQIPLWMYGVLVVLGWNEAMTVLFNPLYFAMMLVLAASAYIILQLGLAGPLLQVARTIFNEIRTIATDKLREAFANVEDSSPGAGGRRLAEAVPASANGTGLSHGEDAMKRGDLLGEKMMEK